MKANLVKPEGRLKKYEFEVEKVVVQSGNDWNSFSESPQERERWTRYSDYRRKNKNTVNDVF